MRAGYWVVSVFAAAWAGAGLIVSGYPAIALLAPLAISAAVMYWAYNDQSTSRDMGDHARKLIRRWSIVEAIAIVIASNLLSRMHRADQMFSAVAVIVGLHFLPLARGLSILQYYATGAGLILIGLVGTLLPATERPLAVGLGAAMVLWGTAFHRLLGSRKAAAS